MNNSKSASAKKIQGAWRRTTIKMGHLGHSSNEGILNFKLMKSISYPQLAELLRRTSSNRYNINRTSGFLINKYNNSRMTRIQIIEMLAHLTNYRPRNI
jgi:hypothetical protein